METETKGPYIHPSVVQKAVRNIIINEMGINKGDVLAKLEDYLEKKVTEALKEERWIERAIETKLEELIAKGTTDRSYYTRKTLSEYIVEEVKKQAREKFEKQFSFSVNERR